MARMIVVDRDGKEHEIEAKPGLKIMEILRELDYGVAAICGGLCSCATCHVYVDESWAARLPKPQSDELELLKELPDFREADLPPVVPGRFHRGAVGPQGGDRAGFLSRVHGRTVRDARQVISSRSGAAPLPVPRRSPAGRRGSGGSSGCSCSSSS